MKIWAHRGCSQCYPENTMTSFEKAMMVSGLTGIELDIQLTLDGELVVIHDERVDRTTDGIGAVKDMTLRNLKMLHIYDGSAEGERIPRMKEVLDLLKPRLIRYRRSGDEKLTDDNSVDAEDGGLRLNIELKNSIYPYPGMEEKIVELVHAYGVQKAVVYSSFYTDSLVKIHKLDPEAELGVLDGRVSDCMYKALGLETVIEGAEIALHPNGGCLDISAERFVGRTVRAYFGGHLYPSRPSGGKMDLTKLENAGVTDVFLNEPERYLSGQA